MSNADITSARENQDGNIILVGLMGAGKTSVGKALARILGKNFMDTDQELERTTGVKVPVIFEIEGESGFRARESKILAELVRLRNVVLATGGGAVLAKENRDLLAANGTVIYLRAPVRSLIKRTRHDRSRPLLQVPDPAARLNALYEQRDPLYREVAHLVVDTGDQSVRVLAGQIEAKLQALAAVSPASTL
jgi:shikimate kinase